MLVLYTHRQKMEWKWKLLYYNDVPSRYYNSTCSLINDYHCKWHGKYSLEEVVIDSASCKVLWLLQSNNDIFLVSWFFSRNYCGTLIKFVKVPYYKKSSSPG